VGRTVVAVNLGLLVTVDKGRLASEDDFHLLKGPALGLRVEEVNGEGHNDTEAHQQDVDTPGDAVHKKRGDVADNEVKEPVGSGGDGSGLGADAERVDLAGVDPADGAPGIGEGHDEDVDENNDGVGGTGMASEIDALTTVVVVNGLADASHDGSDDQHRSTHDRSAGDESPATAPPVNVQDSGNGSKHVEDTVDASGEEGGGGTLETGLLEDGRGVVHDGVYTSQLLEDLNENTKDEAAEDGSLEKLRVAADGLFALNTDGFLDFVELLLDQGVVLVPVAVETGEDDPSILITIFVEQPTGGIGHEEHTDGEDESGGGLDTERNAPRDSALHKRGAVVNPERNQDTDGNGPLLEGDQTTTDFLGGNLGLVERDLEETIR
ncbi:hypothetical protein BC936DRAFT_142198, partial [Jimgerdemannia flammicorona]